jgi:hypothetical protein
LAQVVEQVGALLPVFVGSTQHLVSRTSATGIFAVMQPLALSHRAILCSIVMHGIVMDE